MNGNSYRQLFQDVFRDIRGKFTLIGNKTPFQYLLNKSDLIILTWVSTSFWQAACTKSDIFLLDEGKLTESAEEAVSKRAFYFSTYERFEKELTRYLERGLFSEKSDMTFLRNFMDFDSKGYRDEKVHEILSSIKMNPRFRPCLGSISNY